VANWASYTLHAVSSSERYRQQTEQA